MFTRVAYGGMAGFDTQFPVNGAEVGFDRAAADDQAFGDLRVAQVLHQQAQQRIPEYGRMSELLNDYDSGLHEADRGAVKASLLCVTK